MAKKPRTINYYQKKLREMKKEIKVYHNTLAYFVDAEDDSELIKRVNKYRDLLQNINLN